MKLISVMVADEDNGGKLIGDAIVGARKVIKAWEVDGRICYDRYEALEKDRKSKFRVDVHAALELPKRNMTAQEVVDLIVHNEMRLRAVIAKRNLNPNLVHKKLPTKNVTNTVVEA
jgi:hypothetical protein